MKKHQQDVKGAKKDVALKEIAKGVFGGDEKSEFHLWVSLVFLLWSVAGLAAYSKVLKILWDSNDFE